GLGLLGLLRLGAGQTHRSRRSSSGAPSTPGRGRSTQTPVPTRSGAYPRTFGNGKGCLMAGKKIRSTGRLLTVDQVAELLNTSVRYPRRLVEERRITFVKVGRHVRIPESALDEFITAGTVEPVRLRRGRVA